MWRILQSRNVRYLIPFLAFLEFLLAFPFRLVNYNIFTMVLFLEGVEDKSVDTLRSYNDSTVIPTFKTACRKGMIIRALYKLLFRHIMFRKRALQFQLLYIIF